MRSPAPDSKYSSPSTSSSSGNEENQPKGGKSSRKKKSYNCPECNKSFSQSSNVTRHVNLIHLGLKSFSCNVCDKKFKSALGEKIHMRLHTGEKANIACAYSGCEARFDYISSLRQHMKEAHVTGLNERCQDCGQRFRTPKLLKQHRVFHGHARPFKCALCPSAFKTREGIKTHLKTHQREEYECEICFRVFGSESGYFHHKATHKTEGRSCPYCKKVYLHKSSLIFHVNSQHKLIRYRVNCRICSKEYSRKRDLRRHIERDHWQLNMEKPDQDIELYIKSGYGL